MNPNTLSDEIAKNKKPPIQVTSPIIDLFSPPYVEKALEHGIELFEMPQNSLDNGSPYYFNIPRSQNQYLYPPSLKLYGEIKVLHDDGTDLVEGERVVPVNCFAASLFEKIEIILDNNIISTLDSGNAHYKTYLDCLLSYDRCDEDTHLRLLGFTKDKSVGSYKYLKPDGTEDLTPNSLHAINKNRKDAGIRTRHNFIACSKPFHFMLPLYADFLMTNKLIMPHHSITIKLTRSKDSFSLMSREDDLEYKIVFNDLRLYYERIKLSEDVDEHLVLKAQNECRSYMLTQSEVKVYNLQQNISRKSIIDIYSNILPQKIYITMVTTRAFTGSIKQNPFHFRHNDISKIYARIGGQTVPVDGYSFDFTNNNYVRVYDALFPRTNNSRKKGNLISYEDYGKGYTIIPFDFTPEKCGMSDLHKIKTGTISLEMEFKEELTEPMTLILFAFYNNEVIITPHDNVGMALS
jgi:hypothetical protein